MKGIPRVHVYFRVAGDSLNDCRIMFLTEIYKIEEPGALDGSGVGSDSPLKSKLELFAGL
jgi:hypothetical protein